MIDEKTLMEHLRFDMSMYVFKNGIAYVKPVNCLHYDEVDIQTHGKIIGCVLDIEPCKCTCKHMVNNVTLSSSIRWLKFVFGKCHRDYSDFDDTITWHNYVVDYLKLVYALDELELKLKEQMESEKVK